MLSDAAIQALLGLLTVLFGTFGVKVLDYLKNNNEIALKTHEQKVLEHEQKIKDKDGLIEYLNKIMSEERQRCSEDFLKVQNALDSSIARIESLEKQLVNAELGINCPIPFFALNASQEVMALNRGMLTLMFEQFHINYNTVLHKKVQDIILDSFLLESLSKNSETSIVSANNEHKVEINILNKIKGTLYTKVVLDHDGITPLRFDHWIVIT